MSDCCCGLRGCISEQGGARSHWWVRSPDGDVWEEDMSGTDPGAGPCGSSRIEDTETDDGRRRYWFRPLPTNRELVDWISEARDFASVVQLANIVLPCGFMQPCLLSFQLDHLHVTENRNEPLVARRASCGLGRR